MSGAEESFVLYLSDGELWTSNPDESMLSQMVALASALGARVRGDELETYNSDLTSFTHPDDVAQKGAVQISNSRIFWHRHGCLVVMAVLGIGAVLLMKIFDVSG